MSQLTSWLRLHVRELGFSTLIVILSATVIVLTLQVRKLAPQAEELRQRKAFPFVSQAVPTVRLVDNRGDSITIGETTEGRSQVLFFFTTSCPKCAAILPEWKTLSERIAADSGHNIDVVGVSLSSADSTREYVAANALPYRVVRLTDLKSKRLFRVKGVPMTLVLNWEGQIALVHPGRFVSSAQRDSVQEVAVRVARVKADSGIRGPITTAIRR
jgi:peroxiredoxin